MIRTFLRRVRAYGTFWVAKQSLEHLEALRACELGRVLPLLPKGGTILEIGAGTGWQSKALHEHGFIVTAIDLATSLHHERHIWPVQTYDGSHIPFECGSFDIVYSSNVLEHIAHVRLFQEEIHRVLKPDGIAVHVLPSPSWRIWTNFTHLAKCWTFPNAHGEIAHNAISEIYCFGRAWWARLFLDTGWTITKIESTHLFYTGHSIMDHRLSVGTRQRLSRALGSACNIFVLRKASNLPAQGIAQSHEGGQR